MALLVQDPVGDPNFGLSPAKIERMSVDQWMYHCATVTEEELTQPAIRRALFTYSDHIDARIHMLISAKPMERQAELRTLSKALASYVLAMRKFEVAYHGADPIFTTIHAYRHAWSRLLVREILEGTQKDPGARKVSDGTKALDKLAKQGADALDRPAAQRALKELRASYKLITDRLKNRTRKVSNAVIEYCASNALLVQ